MIVFGVQMAVAAAAAVVQRYRTAQDHCAEDSSGKQAVVGIAALIDIQLWLVFTID